MLLLSLDFLFFFCLKKKPKLKLENLEQKRKMIKPLLFLFFSGCWRLNKMNVFFQAETKTNKKSIFNFFHFHHHQLPPMNDIIINKIQYCFFFDWFLQVNSNDNDDVCVSVFIFDRLIRIRILWRKRKKNENHSNRLFWPRKWIIIDFCCCCCCNYFHPVINVKKNW